MNAAQLLWLCLCPLLVLLQQTTFVVQAMCPKSVAVKTSRKHCE